MAISKTQPMRPAEIELVDTVNAQTTTLANHTQAIADLNTGLASEINARSQADTLLDGKITTEANQRIAADNLLDGKITTETDQRFIADNLLDGKITTETNQRIAGDNAINAVIGDGFSAQNTITDSLAATNQQVSLMNDDLNDVESAVTGIQSALAGIATDVANLLLFEGRIQIGNVTNLTVPANDSISTSTVFAQPFDFGSDCIVLAQVVTSEPSTLFTFTLIDCTYSGFSYSIANSDADAHTVSLGYVAIRTSA